MPNKFVGRSEKHMAFLRRIELHIHILLQTFFNLKVILRLGGSGGLKHKLDLLDMGGLRSGI